MGEAKRRRKAIEKSPCRCGSTLQSSLCCYKNNSWHRTPVQIELHGGLYAGGNDGCYLRDLKNCSDKISREHLVSRSVLDVIQKEKLVVGGFHWLPNNQETSVGKSSLVGKCLCTKHNSSLSPLDEKAGKFFSAIETCNLNQTQPGKDFLFSGHDIERWCFKTLLVMAYSNNFMSEGVKLAPILHPTINPETLLEDPKAWPWGSGLYFLPRLGDTIKSASNFHLAPITKFDTKEIGGLQVVIQGLSFSFFALAPNITRDSSLHKALYRPGKLQFKNANITNTIHLSWEDGAKKHGHIEMTSTPTKSQEG